MSFMYKIVRLAVWWRYSAMIMNRSKQEKRQKGDFPTLGPIPPGDVHYFRSVTCDLDRWAALWPLDEQINQPVSNDVRLCVLSVRQIYPASGVYVTDHMWVKHTPHCQSACFSCCCLVYFNIMSLRLTVNWSCGACSLAEGITVAS